jgi:hypothetical protein
MAYAPHRDFAPTGYYKALRPFTMNGRDYNYDEPVDMTGIEPRRVRLMWENRMIEHAPPPESAPQKPAKAPLAAKKAPAKEPTPEPAPAPMEAPVAPVEAPAAPAAGLRMVSKGFGRWDIVDATGTVVESGITKADAERRVTGIGT